MARAAFVSPIAFGLLLASNVARPQPAEPTAPPTEGASGQEEEPVDLTGAGVTEQPPPYGLSPPQPYHTPPPPHAPRDDDDDDAMDDGPPHGGVQRNFGFGPRVGGVWAFGAGARTGHPHFGVDFSGGWQPLLPTVTPAGSDEGELTPFHSWQLSLLAYVAFNPDSTFVAGMLGGYSYNSVLGRGASLVFDAVVNFSDHVGFHFHAGVGVYPDADERLRREGDIPGRSDIGTPAFRTPAGIGLIIYP